MSVRFGHRTDCRGKLAEACKNTWRHGMMGNRTRNWDKIRLAMGTWMLDAG
jgi:hypothetical protein